MELVSWIADIELRELVVIIVDFAMIAGLSYFILRFIRFSVSLSLALSLFGLFVVYVLVSALGFRATRSIFEHSTQFLAFTVVVLFQDDIRRLILKANPTKLIGRFFGASVDTKANEYLIRHIIDTTQELVAQKLGALIVIDLQNDLGDYTASAVALDAKLTKELLYAVFIPTHGNPLHDGAAVVAQGRIVAAGCFLPLTTNADIDLLMGTRHRAGIGLSEVTGALVVIVSEERQTLTLCEEGRYQRFEGDDVAAFRGELQRRLAPRHRPILRGAAAPKGV